MGQCILRGYMGGFKIPTYSTGASTVYGNKKQGYMMITSSGTLTVKSRGYVDIFLVGGGSSGYGGVQGSPGYGGGAGYTKTVNRFLLARGTYSIMIGAGGATSSSGINSGGYTQFGTDSTNRANGGSNSDGGSGGGGIGGVNNVWGGVGGTDGGNGWRLVYLGEALGYESRAAAGTGQHTTTRAFGGDIALFNAVLFAGGGNGCGCDASRNGYPATPNTGNGGGGRGYHAGGSSANTGGAGGSGICMIRWGY